MILNIQFNKFILSLLAIASLSLSACINSAVRFPSSVDEVYKLNDLKQNLMLAAQNNILFNIPQNTLLEVEKSVIDSRCQQIEKPFWSEKMSVYLNLIRSNPDWFTKFHILEIKKGDSAKASLDKDMDGAIVLSIQYNKNESRGQVSLKTNLPCSAQRVAEYLGKDIIKTQFDFPSSATVSDLLSKATEKNKIERFNFSNSFLTYLAERGFILKFNHDLSFEKDIKNNFVMIEILNRLGKETQQTKPQQHVNLWMKILNDARKSDDIVQLFSIENQTELKSGLKFINGENSVLTDTENKNNFFINMFLGYSFKDGEVISSQLSDLNMCLAKISNQKTKQFIRQPAAELFLSDSYQGTDYSCNASDL